MNKISYYTWFVLILCCIKVGDIQSQTNPWKLTLEDCVKIAIENNINIQNSSIRADMSVLDVTQAKHARYPSLNASASLNTSGRGVDPTSNNLIASQFISNGFGLNSSVNLFQGGRLKYQLDKARLGEEISNSQLEEQIWNISKQVVLSYLDVLYGKESIAAAEANYKSSTLQLEQIDQLIAAGGKPLNDRYQALANQATSEQQLISAIGQYESAIVNLKQIMQVQNEREIEVISPDIDLDNLNNPNKISVEDIMSIHTEIQPSLRTSNLQILSADKDIKIAKSGFYPRLTLGGNLATNYSSIGKKLTGYDNIINNQSIIIDGNMVTVGFPSQVPITEDQPYFEQLDQNFSYGAGLSLNVPIYNNWNTKLNVQRARLSKEISLNNLDQVYTNIYQDVQKVLIDAKNAKANYEATKKSYEAAKLAYEAAKRNLELGVGTTFQTTTLKNQLDSTNSQLIRTKYQYLFMSKMIDYYMGKPITL